MWNGAPSPGAPPPHPQQQTHRGAAPGGVEHPPTAGGIGDPAVRRSPHAHRHQQQRRHVPVIPAIPTHELKIPSIAPSARPSSRPSSTGSGSSGGGGGGGGRPPPHPPPHQAAASAVGEAYPRENNLLHQPGGYNPHPIQPPPQQHRPLHQPQHQRHYYQQPPPKKHLQHQQPKRYHASAAAPLGAAPTLPAPPHPSPPSAPSLRSLPLSPAAAAAAVHPSSKLAAEADTPRRSPPPVSVGGPRRPPQPQQSPPPQPPPQPRRESRGRGAGHGHVYYGGHYRGGHYDAATAARRPPPSDGVGAGGAGVGSSSGGAGSVGGSYCGGSGTLDERHGSPFERQYSSGSEGPQLQPQKPQYQRGVEGVRRSPFDWQHSGGSDGPPPQQTLHPQQQPQPQQKPQPLLQPLQQQFSDGGVERGGGGRHPAHERQKKHPGVAVEVKQWQRCSSDSGDSNRPPPSPSQLQPLPQPLQQSQYHSRMDGNGRRSLEGQANEGALWFGRLPTSEQQPKPQPQQVEEVQPQPQPQGHEQRKEQRPPLPLHDSAAVRTPAPAPALAGRSISTSPRPTPLSHPDSGGGCSTSGGGGGYRYSTDDEAFLRGTILSPATQPSLSLPQPLALSAGIPSSSASAANAGRGRAMLPTPGQRLDSGQGLGPTPSPAVPPPYETVQVTTARAGASGSSSSRPSSAESTATSAAVAPTPPLMSPHHSQQQQQPIAAEAGSLMADRGAFQRASLSATAAVTTVAKVMAGTVAAAPPSGQFHDTDSFAVLASVAAATAEATAKVVEGEARSHATSKALKPSVKPSRSRPRLPLSRGRKRPAPGSASAAGGVSGVGAATPVAMAATATATATAMENPVLTQPQPAAGGGANSSPPAGVVPKKERTPTLEPEMVVELRRWLVSDEHICHPYPTKEEMDAFALRAGVSLPVMKDWFGRNRTRFWKNYCKDNGIEIVKKKSNKGSWEAKRETVPRNRKKETSPKAVMPKKGVAVVAESLAAGDDSVPLSPAPHALLPGLSWSPMAVTAGAAAVPAATEKATTTATNVASPGPPVAPSSKAAGSSPIRTALGGMLCWASPGGRSQFMSPSQPDVPTKPESRPELASPAVAAVSAAVPSPPSSGLACSTAPRVRLPPVPPTQPQPEPRRAPSIADMVTRLETNSAGPASSGSAAVCAAPKDLTMEAEAGVDAVAQMARVGSPNSTAAASAVVPAADSAALADSSLPSSAQPGALVSRYSKSDVLSSGRGQSKCTKHSGNLRFVGLCAERKIRYDASDTEGRTAIAEEVVRLVRDAGGRFLRKVEGGGDEEVWKVMEHKGALQKTKARFQDMNKGRRSKKTKKLPSTAKAKTTQEPAVVFSTVAVGAACDDPADSGRRKRPRISDGFAADDIASSDTIGLPGNSRNLPPRYRKMSVISVGNDVEPKDVSAMTSPPRLSASASRDAAAASAAIGPLLSGEDKRRRFDAVVEGMMNELRKARQRQHRRAGDGGDGDAVDDDWLRAERQKSVREQLARRWRVAALVGMSPRGFMERLFPFVCAKVRRQEGHRLSTKLSLPPCGATPFRDDLLSSGKMHAVSLEGGEPEDNNCVADSAKRSSQESVASHALPGTEPDDVSSSNETPAAASIEAVLGLARPTNAISESTSPCPVRTLPFGDGAVVGAVSLSLGARRSEIKNVSLCTVEAGDAENAPDGLEPIPSAMELPGVASRDTPLKCSLPGKNDEVAAFAVGNAMPKGAQSILGGKDVKRVDRQACSVAPASGIREGTIRTAARTALKSDT